MHGTSTLNTTLVTLLLLLVIGIVGWLAYERGFLRGNSANLADRDSGIEITVGGSDQDDGVLRSEY